jgi:uncharacterized protein YndB with AHSA1/START domain
MIRFQIDRTIPRPRQEVFDRLAEIGAYGAWLPPSVIFRGARFRTPGSVPDVDVAYAEHTPLGTFAGRIVEFDPPRAIAFATPMVLLGRRVFESRPRYVLEHTGAATVVHHFAEGEFLGSWRVFEPAGRRLARYERTRVMDALVRSFTVTPG